jgi:SAM-dependent methyltransferase
MSQKKKIYPNPAAAATALRKRSEEASASDWDAFYGIGKSQWHSSGVGRIARLILSGSPRGSDLLEVGCGTGADAKELVRLGFDYSGIDFSDLAIGQAKEYLKGMGVTLVCADFFLWKPKRRYAVVYEKGVFHGLGGLRRRQSFARRVAMALDDDGIWITVSGTADRFDPRFPRGAIFLTHLVEAVEPYFEILKIVKGPYGVRKPVRNFNAWYGLFRRRR